jgi:hypothetical protein
MKIKDLLLTLLILLLLVEATKKGRPKKMKGTSESEGEGDDMKIEPMGDYDDDERKQAEREAYLAPEEHPDFPENEFEDRSRMENPELTEEQLKEKEIEKELDELQPMNDDDARTPEEMEEEIGDDEDDRPTDDDSGHFEDDSSSSALFNDTMGIGDEDKTEEQIHEDLRNMINREEKKFSYYR